MRALAQELIGLQGPWMSTDRNEKISNHEKDMARDSFPSREWDWTHSVSGVQNVIISVSLCCGCLCWEWRHVSGHKAKDSAGLEGKGWNGKVMFGAPWCGLCGSVSSFGRLQNLQGPASLSKLNISDTFQIPFAKRKLWERWPGTTQVPLGAHPDLCLEVKEPFPACSGLWIRGKTSLCCSSSCCPGALLQAHVAVSPLCLTQCLYHSKPSSEPLSPRENCFNLIKWRWNLKWLNVYLLTGRNVP